MLTGLGLFDFGMPGEWLSMLADSAQQTELSFVVPTLAVAELPLKRIRKINYLDQIVLISSMFNSSLQLLTCCYHYFEPKAGFSVMDCNEPSLNLYRT